MQPDSAISFRDPEPFRHGRSVHSEKPLMGIKRVGVGAEGSRAVIEHPLKHGQALASKDRALAPTVSRRRALLLFF